MKKFYLIAIILLAFSVYMGCKKDDNNDGGEVDCSMPCPETPTVTYEGKVYNTVLIGDQCWFKENLNIGTMINGNEEMTDNGVIEKYCYKNEEDECNFYGGLYQWNEMMQYTIIKGVQGICPDGWHLPTDDEFKILEGTVDSQYPVGDPIWNTEGWRGFDASLNLKSTSGWYFGGNGTGLYCFTVLPGGFRSNKGNISYGGKYAYFWSSSGGNSYYARYRKLYYHNDDISNFSINKDTGFSVRCLKN